MRYYSFKVALNVGSYNGPFVTNQTIQISNTSLFCIKWLSVVSTTIVSSTAKGSLRVNSAAILNVYGNTISLPLVKVAQLADVIGAATLNGFLVSCNSYAPFQGKIQVPALQQIIIETVTAMPDAIYGSFTAADVTNVAISNTVVIGWDDNVNDTLD